MIIKNILFVLLFCSYSMFGQVNVEKWRVFEITLNGTATGNPFKEVTLSCRFIKDNDTITVPDFYDGEGIYKIRFMPQKEGKWTYLTISNVKKLDNKKGSFVCTPALKGNHGPVVVKDTFYFVFDECRYEGTIPWLWGNLTAQSLTERFWRGVTNGGYVGHGETYITENPVKLPNESSDILWWSKGGILRGESPERIKFLRGIIDAAPAQMKPIPLFTWMPFSCIGIPHEYYLGYLNDAQPRSIVIELPKDALYQVEVIDTWNMTITQLQKKFSGQSLIELPAKPYMAVRIIKQKY